jgi:hypothetical protein
MKNKIIYLAGWCQQYLPKGQKANWREPLIAKMQKSLPDAVFIDPSIRDINENDYKAIMGRDIFLIKNSDYLLANATDRIGVGTSQEILIANYFGVKAVAVCPSNSFYRIDKVRVRDIEYNDWVHPFLASSCQLANDFEEALEIIANDDNKQTNKLLDETLEYYTKNYLEQDKLINPLLKNHEK